MIKTPTRYTVSIDTGLRHCGCAIFDGTVLKTAKLVKSPEKAARGPGAHVAMALAVQHWIAANVKPAIFTLVVESMRVYPHAAQQKGDLNDLLELSGVCGAIAGVTNPIHLHHYYPGDWKGQVPKKIMTQRILIRLTDEEKAAMENKEHNTIDGIGIGLKYLGRL